MLAAHSDYLRDHVLIEFGARNSTEPSKKHNITTLLAQAVEDSLKLPTALITILSPIRTFWEKATLIHVECNRGRLLENPDRLSRHWYDLAMLANSWVCEESLNQTDVLTNVVQHKTAFFNASYAYYEECLSKKFRLIPSEKEQINLAIDFKKMQEAGMFQVSPPQFKEIINTLSSLERQINRH